MFFRILLLILIAFFVARAIRSRLLRRSVRNGGAGASRDLGVDPKTIRDAEFTEVSDTEENRK